jgi:hypothetical protein
MSTEEQEQMRVAWDKVAAGYDEFVTPTYFSLGAEALRRAGLRPGMRLLDVASGSRCRESLCGAPRRECYVSGHISRHGRAAQGACS